MYDPYKNTNSATIKTKIHIQSSANPEDFLLGQYHGCDCVSVLNMLCLVLLSIILTRSLAFISRLYLVLGASLNNISALSDLISNQIPTNVTKWAFEIKLYRERSSPPQSAQQEQQQQQLSSLAIGGGGERMNFLHTLSFSQHAAAGEIVCLVNQTGSVLQGQFEALLNTKLQSLWQLRQVVKGEGSAYEMNGGEYWIRIGNMMLQSTFRGLVIEIEYTECTGFWTTVDKQLSQSQLQIKKEVKEEEEGDNSDNKNDIMESPVMKRIRQILESLNLPQRGKLILGPPGNLQAEPFTKIQTAWQYVEALQSRH